MFNKTLIIFQENFKKGVENFDKVFKFLSMYKLSKKYLF